jgi:hypothetical protein
MKWSQTALFFFETYEWAEKARVFAPGKPFQPCLKLVGKAWRLNLELINFILEDKARIKRLHLGLRGSIWVGSLQP